MSTWLLILGLVVFNIGCFASPNLFETFIASLDVRWWPLWWLAVLFGVLAVMCYRGVTRRYIVSFGVVLLLLAGFRIYTELTRYCVGDTTVVRDETTADYDFLLQFPKGYGEFDGKRPLIVFLHGAGEVGRDVMEIASSSVCRYADGRIAASDFPFVVATPVTPKHGWEPSQVVRLVDTVFNDARFGRRIDSSRVYLTGFSMGGFGTFRTACAFPDRFAAIVPLAGGGEPDDAAKLQTVPTWAFHGDADEAVPYSASKNMIDAMENLDHPNVKLTTLHGAGHGIPDAVYTRTDLYRWLLEQKKELNRP